MDKIFEHDLKQDSVLCKIQPEILQKISKFLLPVDVVHLSHTCKDLHRKLPFYLIKSGNFTVITAPGKKDSSKIWYDGPAINFSVSEINIPITRELRRFKCIWIQIIRNGIVVLESQKFHGNCLNNIRLTKKNAALRDYKPGDRLRFMAGVDAEEWTKVCTGIFQVSLQLENYKYDKPIYVARKVEGYEQFKSPESICIVDDDYLKCLWCPSLPCLRELSLAGDICF